MMTQKRRHKTQTKKHRETAMGKLLIDKKKKGYTTVLLELSVKATAKVPAPASNGLNGRVKFSPERAKPALIRQSLERVFASGK
jgi:hypothetical protein